MIRDVKDRTLEFLLNDWRVLRKADEETEDEKVRADLEDRYEYEDIPCLMTEHEDQEDGEEFFDIRKAWVYDRFEVIPVALTREQIKRYNPPPNPAKRTDPRAKDFIKEHGSTSWEVDALRPEVLNAILETAIAEKIDMKLYKSVVDREQEDKDKLQQIIEDNFSED